MATIAKLFIALVLCCQGAIAKEECSPPTEYRPALCKITLPRINTIKVEKNAARSPADNQATNCAGFNLSAVMIRRYFSKALKIKTTAAIDHTLDWLPCYASGTLLFANGKTAQWHIEQAQTARLTFSDTEELLLYCPRCRFKPFKW